MTEPDLKAMTGQELAAFSESQIGMHSWNRASLLREEIGKFEAEGDAERAEDARRELLLYSFAVRQGADRRFIPQMGGTTETGEKFEYPNIEVDFPADTIDYFKRRVAETNNPSLKARYSDFLWEKKEGFPYAKMAIEAYIEAASLYYQLGDLIFEVGDALDRALDLATRFRNVPLIETAVKAHHDLMRQMSADKQYRPVLELAQSLIEAAHTNGADVDWAALIAVLEEAIADYVANDPDNYIARRAFMERLITLHESQGDTAAAEAVKLRRAASFVEEAQEKGGPQANILSSHFYELAVQAYEEIPGHEAEVNVLKVKIERANAAARSEFTTISVPFEIPIEPIETRLGALYKGHTATEIFQHMMNDPELLPSYDDALDSAKQAMEEFVFQNMIATKVMRGNLTVKTIATDADRLRYHATQYFQNNYRLVADVYLIRIFDILRAEHSNYVEELATFLGAAEVISPARLAILQHGLIHYSRDELVAANHILALQFEGILRDMLGLINLPTWKTERDSTDQRALTLPQILTAFKDIPGIDQDLVKFISILLNDQLGDNYRNDIAHALAPIEAFTRKYAELSILLLIRLCSYGVVITPAIRAPVA